jgi:hypothetical protein
MFAAAIPAAGPADPVDAPLYASQNLWAINGTNDSTSAENTAAIDAIRKIGGNPIYTLLQGRGHDTWRSLYKDPQLIAWTFAQRRGVPWWSHPPAAPTMLQADAVNGPVVLSGGVSVVPPPGLTATTPFPTTAGVGGPGGAAGAAGSSGTGGSSPATGASGGGGAGTPVAGSGGAPGLSTGGSSAPPAPTVPASTGGAAPAPSGSGGSSNPVVAGSTGTGGAAAPPSSSGGASVPGNQPGGSTDSPGVASSDGGGCSVGGGTGGSAGSPAVVGPLLMLAFLVSRRRRPSIRG